jgi:hypothetical protein
MLVSLTVGKVDAGVAVLLTQDKRLVRPFGAQEQKQFYASLAQNKPTNSLLSLD